MADLTSLANLKAWLGITGAADDVLLTQLVARASGLCRTYLNRDILTASFTEVINGTGTARVQVKNFPITAVTSVSVLGVAIPLSVNGSYGYAWDQYGIYLASGSFSTNFQSITVVYTGGFAATPDDLEQAVIEIAGHIFRRRARIGEISKSIQGEVISFDHSDIPPEVKVVWDRYKRVSGW